MLSAGVTPRPEPSGRRDLPRPRGPRGAAAEPAPRRPMPRNLADPRKRRRRERPCASTRAAGRRGS